MIYRIGGSVASHDQVIDYSSATRSCVKCADTNPSKCFFCEEECVGNHSQTRLVGLCRRFCTVLYSTVRIRSDKIKLTNKWDRKVGSPCPQPLPCS